MRVTECHPCQIGDHKRHHEVVQSVPEGMMGGARCFCNGECQENKDERIKKFLKRIWGR